MLNTTGYHDFLWPMNGSKCSNRYSPGQNRNRIIAADHSRHIGGWGNLMVADGLSAMLVEAAKVLLEEQRGAGTDEVTYGDSRIEPKQQQLHFANKSEMRSLVNGKQIR